ncbi:MAG: hypothetical protein NTU53_23825 [Planctomycetota bacterium]|nr:hypothetical protein [Planctomycetota bacterium]
MYEQLTVQKLEETLAKLQQDITIAGERHRAAFAAHQQAADAYNAVRGELKVAALLRKLKAQAAEQREAEACAKIQSEFSAACVAYLRRLNPE